MVRWMVGAGAWALAVGCGPLVPSGVANDDGSTSRDSAGEDEGDGPGSDTSVDTVGSGVASEGGTGDESGSVPSCPSTGSCDECAAWQTSYQGSSGSNDAFLGLSIAPDGTIVAVGRRDWVQDVGAGDLVIVGYAADGRQLWDSTPLGSDDGTEDQGHSVAFAADGRIALLGARRVDQGYESVILVLNAQRELLWSDSIAGAQGIGWAAAAIFTDEGDLIVVGAATRDDGLNDGLVRRYDIDGAVQWERMGDDFAIPPGFLGDVSRAGDALVLSGGTFESSPSDVWLARMTLAGTQEWVVQHDSDTHAWASSAAALTDGDVIAVGAEFDDDGNAQSWAGRFARDGTNLWSHTYPANGCCANGLARVVLDDQDRIFVMGAQGTDGGGLLMKVQELDCDGEIAWEWNHESPGWNAVFPGGLAWSAATGLVASGSDYLQMNDQQGYLVRLDP